MIYLIDILLVVVLIAGIAWWKNNLMTTIKNFFLKIISAPNFKDEEDARRRKQLNLILLIVVLAAILAFVGILITDTISTEPLDRETQLLYPLSIFIIIGVAVLYLINRYVSGTLAAILFVLFLIIMVPFSDTPEQVAFGRSLIPFTLPIIFAAMVLQPRYSYLVAGVCSIILSVISIGVLHEPMPNIPAIIIFFILAWVSHISSRGLKKALEKMTASNKKLQESEKDIRQMFEVLRESEEQYRGIFDGVNDAILVETTKGDVLDVNMRACKMFGWTYEEFLTKNIKDMVPPENQALLPEEQDESTLSEEPFETINMRANGEYFPVSVSGRIEMIENQKRLLIVVRDITEQKEFENELKKQHQFLSHVIESLTQPFYVINVDDYSIEIANSAARGGMALDPGATCYALTHHLDTPCSGNEHPCPLKEVVERREVVQFEHIHYDRDGTPRNFEVHGYPIFDSRGKVKQMIEYSLDITERKKAEENARLLEHAVEQSQDGMAIAHMDGQIRFVNHSWANMHGYEIHELSEEYLSIFHSERQLITEVNPFNKLVIEKGFNQGEVGHKRKDGSTFPTWMSVSTLQDNDTGTPVALVASAQDITERKKAEEELLKLSRAIMHSPASVVITDLQGTIEYVNPAFTKVTGYSREEALGSKPSVLKSGFHEPEFYKELWRTLAGGKVWQGQFCNKDKEGKLFWESASISPVANIEGEFKHYVAVKEDITVRKQAMVDLEKAKNAAEAAAQAKADFLANMSHEIRTPLNAIYGMTSLMLDTPLNEEQQDFIETIRGGSDTLLNVINDILDFSKIEAGKMELEEQPFHLRNCVEDTLDLLAEKAAEKMLNLAYLIEEGTPYVVVGDITRLRQILVNLLNNAIKFTDKGEVVINVKSCLVENNQHELQFSIRDTGIGIPKDKLNKLFQSFSQVDTSTTRKYGGTGLGLAISKELVEKMGGTLWVESEEGKGSIFHFTIVVDAEDSGQPLISSDDQAQLSGKSILIVDDNTTNRLVLVRQTESWGMKPCAVESGAEALSLLEKDQKFDIAILDMQMPGMDGFALAKKISKKYTKKTLPLIILTSIKRDKTRANDSKITAFLNKPIRTSNLFNILINIISSAPVPEKKVKKILGIDSTLGEKHPLRILLVEDNMINQKVALKLLERLGYQADLAANGIEAIEALDRQTYDVIFMDIQMPEMDGDEATRRIREKQPQERQPYIIAMTAHALEGDREKYIARGMDDYVSKPINVKALIETLKKAYPLEGKP